MQGLGSPLHHAPGVSRRFSVKQKNLGKNGILVPKTLLVGFYGKIDCTKVARLVEAGILLKFILDRVWIPASLDSLN
jgi:hypothetical protein